MWFLRVQSRMASLDGLSPSTNGLTIGLYGMVNVFMSMEHQSILSCNYMVVQVCEIFFLLSLHLKENGALSLQVNAPQEPYKPNFHFSKHFAVFHQEIHINNYDACFFITNSTHDMPQFEENGVSL
jgi:hypothetical protein